MNTTPWKILCLGTVLGLAQPAWAQFYSIAWSTIDGGGFTLNGTVGQPDAGASMSGGIFTVTGGFWPAIVEELPRLRIILDAGNVVLAWPDPSTGFQLQAAPTPLGPGWTTVSQAPVVVAGEKRVILTPTGSGRMFRLSKP